MKGDTWYFENANNDRMSKECMHYAEAHYV